METYVNHTKRSIAALALGAGLSLCMLPSLAAGTEYPSKTVTVYVGFAAGGPTDVVARMLAEGLSKKLGQAFIVENRVGASGELAANLLKKAAPDGYTLMVGANGTLSILPVVKKELAYKPLVDFTPVAPVARFPYYLVVSKDSALHSYKDLVDQGRRRGAGLTFGSAGPGSANHLAREWFSKAAEIDAVHVPYKGDAAVLNDLIANRLSFAFLAGNVVKPQVEAGNLRILASASTSAGAEPSNIPVLGTGLLRGFSAEPWNGLLGPAGLPKEIVGKLNRAVNEVMSSEAVVAKLKALDQYPFKGSAGVFAEHIKTQTERTADIVRKSNLTIE